MITYMHVVLFTLGVMLKNIYVYTYKFMQIHAIKQLMKKAAMALRENENKEEYMRRFGRRKGKG